MRVGDDLCGAVSTRGLHTPAPPLFDPFVYYRSQAKRKMLRQKNFTFAAMAGGVNFKMAAAYRAEG